MGAQLKTKIQNWKNKVIRGRRSRNLLKAQLKRREAQIDRLEAENRRLQKLVEPQVVVNHTYPAQLIALAVFMLSQHDRLLCYSDIIQSTFGRYKNKSGMAVISADVLSIALYNQTIDQ